MSNLSNLKEQALERKRAHLKKQLEAEVEKNRRASRKRRSSRQAAREKAASSATAQRRAPAKKTKKKKSRISKLAIEILLILGAALALLVFINPFK